MNVFSYWNSKPINTLQLPSFFWSQVESIPFFARTRTSNLCHAWHVQQWTCSSRLLPFWGSWRWRGRVSKAQGEISVGSMKTKEACGSECFLVIGIPSPLIFCSCLFSSEVKSDPFLFFAQTRTSNLHHARHVQQWMCASRDYALFGVPLRWRGRVLRLRVKSRWVRWKPRKFGVVNVF